MVSYRAVWPVGPERAIEQILAEAGVEWWPGRRQFRHGRAARDSPVNQDADLFRPARIRGLCGGARRSAHPPEQILRPDDWVHLAGRRLPVIKKKEHGKKKKELLY